MATALIDEVDAAHLVVAPNLIRKEESSPLLANNKATTAKFFSLSTLIDFAVCISLILVWTINAVLFKKTTNAMGNYASFMSQFKIFFMFVGFVVVWKVEESGLNAVTADMMRAPKWPLILLGLNDCFEALVQTFGGIHTAGSLQVLLLQTLIPMSMVASIVILKAKYAFVQYIGAAVIIVGVLIALWPNLFPLHQNSLLWNLVFLSCTLFGTAGAISKEALFRTQDYPVGYFSAWTCAAQFISGFLVGPFTMLVPPNAHSMSFYPTNLWDGFRCLGGSNALPGDDCPNARWLLPVGTVTTFMLAFLLIVVLKRYGAAFMYVVSTLRLPIINLAFTLRWVMGSAAQKAGTSNYIGLAAIFTGLMAYRFGPLVQERLLECLNGRNASTSLKSINSTAEDGA